MIKLFWLVNLVMNVTIINLVLLAFLRLVKKRRTEKSGVEQDVELVEFPPVTIQLPLYNESDVLERLLQAVAAIDYPSDKLQIQVLDDSEDDTTEKALTLTRQYQQSGINMELVRRPNREGYKAGALDYGLATATGEYIAVFDADFLPQGDFLLKTLPSLVDSPEVAFVQARWGHVNREYSLLTRLQSLALDGHFLIDQSVRSWAQLPMNFNGTAGVWRREAIEASGGWHGDTVCEDLDLSYRAMMTGWKARYLEHLVVPAEISPQLGAFKQQQFRWAKGSAQVGKKLIPQILTSKLAWWKKVMGLLHLVGNSCAPLMLLMILLTPLVALTATSESLRGLWVLSLSQAAFPFFYIVVLSIGFPDTWRERAKRELPWLLLLGIAMSLNNTVAVIQGLFDLGGNRFERTPKFNVVKKQDVWNKSKYRLPIKPMVFGELAVSLYSFASVWVIWNHGMKIFAPGMVLYGFAFGGFALVSLWQARHDMLALFRRAEA